MQPQHLVVFSFLSKDILGQFKKFLGMMFGGLLFPFYTKLHYCKKGVVSRRIAMGFDVQKVLSRITEKSKQWCQWNETILRSFDLFKPISWDKKAYPVSSRTVGSHVEFSQFALWTNGNFYSLAYELNRLSTLKSYRNKPLCLLAFLGGFFFFFLIFGPG